MRNTLDPAAFIAVISLSELSLPKPSSVASSIAIANVFAKIPGIRSAVT
jgi:hypothetical protein